MSLAFSNTTNKNGILQTIERNCGFNDGDITGSTLLLAQFTADVNLALDTFVEMAIKSSGTWQWDDSNHTDYPIITTNLVQGQRDYGFTVDGSGNLILDIYKVFVKGEDGVYREIYPVDVQSSIREETREFTDGQNGEGRPYRYDKTANGIFLDWIPNYNSTAGLKMYINREASAFLTSDTTKKPGIPGIFHEYLALRPSYYYCLRNSLPQTKGLGELMVIMENNIKSYFSKRTKDEPQRMMARLENNK